VAPAFSPNSSSQAPQREAVPTCLLCDGETLIRERKIGVASSDNSTGSLGNRRVQSGKARHADHRERIAIVGERQAKTRSPSGRRHGRRKCPPGASDTIGELHRARASQP